MKSPWERCNSSTLYEEEVRHSNVLPMDGDIVYRKNNQELTEELQLEHTSGQWRLLIHLRSVWRQYYSTMEIISLLSHWLMHFTWKTRKRTFRFCFKKKKHTQNTAGLYVLTWTLEQWWLCCKVDTLHPAAFNLNGAAERGNASTE